MIGIIVTAITDILLQWQECKNKNQDFNWEKYNGSRTVKRAVIGGTVGSCLGYVTYEYKINRESELPFETDNYLKKLLTEESLKNNPDILSKVISARNEIKNSLWEEFKSDLVAFPEDTGSFAKYTVLTSNFDLDVILPFKKESFKSLEIMYDTVYKIIKSKFGRKANISKQSKTIGLSIIHKGNPLYFDIVPGREIHNYKFDKNLNLYVNPRWAWQKGGSFKTNTEIQNRILVNNPKARATVKLLKKYKNTNGVNIPTTIIEQYTIEALSDKKYGLCYSETENLLNTMDYISNKITQNKLTDWANSNNNLHEKIDYFERKFIAKQLSYDIECIERNPRYIKEIFS